MGEVVQLFAIGTLKHNSTAGDGKNTHELLKSILYSQISNQDNSTLWLGAMFEGSAYAYWWAPYQPYINHLRALDASTTMSRRAMWTYIQPDHRPPLPWPRISQVLRQLFLGEGSRIKQLLQHRHYATLVHEHDRCASNLPTDQPTDQP